MGPPAGAPAPFWATSRADLHSQVAAGCTGPRGLMEVEGARLGAKAPTAPATFDGAHQWARQSDTTKRSGRRRQTTRRLWGPREWPGPRARVRSINSTLALGQIGQAELSSARALSRRLASLGGGPDLNERRARTFVSCARRPLGAPLSRAPGEPLAGRSQLFGAGAR